MIKKYLDESGLATAAKIIKQTHYSKTEADTLYNEKVDKVNGKDLSTNDYTNDDKDKLTTLPTIVVLESEEAYNDLDEKDSNTLYLIKGDPGVFVTYDALDVAETVLREDFNTALDKKVDSTTYGQLSREVSDLRERIKTLEDKFGVSSDE